MTVYKIYRLFMYLVDADGRGHFIFYFFLFYLLFFAYIYLRAQLERDPESDRLGHPPPQLANYMSTMHRYRDGSVQEQVDWHLP